MPETLNGKVVLVTGAAVIVGPLLALTYFVYKPVLPLFVGMLVQRHRKRLAPDIVPASENALKGTTVSIRAKRKGS